MNNNVDEATELFEDYPATNSKENALPKIRLLEISASQESANLAAMRNAESDEKCGSLCTCFKKLELLASDASSFPSQEFV